MRLFARSALLHYLPAFSCPLQHAIRLASPALLHKAIACKLDFVSQNACTCHMGESCVKCSVVVMQIKDYGDLSYLVEAEYERQLVGLSQDAELMSLPIGTRGLTKGKVTSQHCAHIIVWRSFFLPLFSSRICTCDFLICIALLPVHTHGTAWNSTSFHTLLSQSKPNHSTA